MAKTRRRAQAQQIAQQEEEEEAQKVEQEQQQQQQQGERREEGEPEESASEKDRQATQQDGQSQDGDGNGDGDQDSGSRNEYRSGRDREVYLSNESQEGNSHSNLHPSIQNGDGQNGLSSRNELFNQDDHSSSHSHHQLHLHLQPPGAAHPDLLSPMSTAPLFNNNNNHPLQNHPDPDYRDQQQQHLQSPGSNQGHQGQSSSPHNHNHNSFQYPSSQSNHNSNHRQPQTQQFGFLDPFHHNAHLEEHNSPEDSQHQYRPTSSAGHQHHLGINHSHPDHFQQSHLPHPGLPQYMHRASISGPIPTHGIYPPPNPSFLPHNHGGNAPPHADQMAAWANAAGGARPHTADGMFGQFGGFPGTAWGAMGGFDYRGPRASTGSIAGSVASPPPHQRIFSHMSEEDQLQHQHHHQQHPPYPHQHQDRSNSIASGSGAMLGEEEGNHSFDSNNDGNQQHQHHPEGTVPVKKRPRRRYDEIERLYTCGWQGCAKSYGTLNHLNAHVSMQKHGEKRSPTEFKEMRRAWRKGKREEEQRRQQALAKANEEAIVRAKMAAHFDPNLGGDGGGGSGSNFSIPAGMAPPPPSNTHTVFSPAHAHPHPQGGNMHHPFSVPSHSAHPLPPPPHAHGSMGAPPQIYQQMNRYSLSGANGNGNGGEGSPSFNNESDHHQSQNDHHDARPFTSAGQHQHPVAYLLSAHRGSI